MKYLLDKIANRRFSAFITVALFIFSLALLVFLRQPAQAEYGDVIINNKAEKNGMRPVIFPHWFHRIRFKCKVCHLELGFQMKAGSNNITMESIIMEEFCGACHNGSIAWSPENCDMCHSGKPGLKSGIKRGHATGGAGIL